MDFPEEPTARACALHEEMNTRRRFSYMIKRTLAGLTFLLAITALNSSPASAFGWWCGPGYGYAPGAYYAPRTYFYTPRARVYYSPRARFYRRAYYRPFVGRAFYRPGVRVYRRAYYRPFVRRAAFYRPGVRVYRRDVYRPGVRRAAFYRSGVRVDRPRAGTYRSGRWGRDIPLRYRGRLP